jgi:GT2 family glycosyltransferase
MAGRTDSSGVPAATFSDAGSPSETSEELLTALLCTRGRGANVARCVRSLLNNHYPAFEVLVIDQSDDDASERSLEPYRGDPRLRYFRSKTVGKGTAANLGLAEAKGAIIVMTDDDCEVPADWLHQMSGAFRDKPEVAVVFCNVVSAEHDETSGYVPTYVRHGDKLVKAYRDKCAARGIGAGMAFRRDVLREMGGFDTMLGPGGRFFACFDGDVAARALVAGHYLYETDRTSVLHYGFRSSAQGRQQSYRTWVGIGAAYSKPLKCGHWRFGLVPAYEFFVMATGALVRDALHLQRPRGWMRVLGFVQGFAWGLLTQVDAKTLLFIPPGV